MSKKYRISYQLLCEIVICFDEEATLEKSGRLRDLGFINEGAWLQDAAVIDDNYRTGSREITIIFSHIIGHSQPVIHAITRCRSEQKNSTAVFYMRRNTAKDCSGPLSINDRMLCNN